LVTPQLTFPGVTGDICVVPTVVEGLTFRQALHVHEDVGRFPAGGFFIVNRCLFAGTNQFDYPGGGGGFCVYAFSARVEVRECVFVGCVAGMARSGGGFSTQCSSVNFSDVVFVGNPIGGAAGQAMGFHRESVADTDSDSGMFGSRVLITHVGLLAGGGAIGISSKASALVVRPVELDSMNMSTCGRSAMTEYGTGLYLETSTDVHCNRIRFGTFLNVDGRNGFDLISTGVRIDAEMRSWARYCCFVTWRVTDANLAVLALYGGDRAATRPGFEVQGCMFKNITGRSIGRAEMVFDCVFGQPKHPERHWDVIEHYDRP
jgi:hypothetical protein